MDKSQNTTLPQASVKTRTEDGCRVVAVVTDVTVGFTSCESMMQRAFSWLYQAVMVL